MGNFNIYTNTTIDDTTPFKSVVFSQNSPLLEVELNEAQALLNKQIKDTSRIFLGNLFSGTVTVSNGKIALMNSLLINGYVLHTKGITIDYKPGTDYWFNLYEKEFTDETDIKSAGYTEGQVIENTIADTRVPAPMRQTTRRKGIEFSVSNERDASAGASVKVFSTDSNGNVAYHLKQGIYSIYEELQEMADEINENIRNEIDALKKSVSDGKTAVAAAITAMNQATASDAAYSTMAANIRKISSDATASAGHILTGKTAYAGGKKITGSMPDKGAVTHSLPINGSYIIPAGYHNGSGKVTQNIGTQGAQTITPGTSDQYISAGKYLTGIQTVKGDTNLAAGNIAAGKTIFNVSGTFTNDANASSSNLLSGKTAYAGGKKITGNITSFKDYRLAERAKPHTGGLLIRELPSYSTASGEIVTTHEKIKYLCIREDIGYTPSSNFDLLVKGEYLGNATPDKVIAGSTFSSENGVCIEGKASPSANVFYEHESEASQRFPTAIHSFSFSRTVSNAFTASFVQIANSSRPSWEWGVDLGRYSTPKIAGGMWNTIYANISGNIFAAYFDIDSRIKITFFFEKYYSDCSKEDYNDSMPASAEPDFADLVLSEFPGVNIIDENLVFIAKHTTWSDASDGEYTEVAVSFILDNSFENERDYGNQYISLLKEPFQVKFPHATLTMQFEYIKTLFHGNMHDTRTLLKVLNWGGGDTEDDYYKFELATVPKYGNLKITDTRTGQVSL